MVEAACGSAIRGLGGLELTEIRAAWPERFEAWAADPVGFAPPDGENTLAVAASQAAIHEILAAHPGREIIVVAGGINRLDVSVIFCNCPQAPVPDRRASALFDLHRAVGPLPGDQTAQRLDFAYWAGTGDGGLIADA
ncbi:MAG: histidine phosphatase family protein [Desulfurivibrio sp.]|nr:histidine phosphatase family protein [Desulfurivibrio sp.]